MMILNARIFFPFLHGSIFFFEQRPILCTKDICFTYVHSIHFLFFFNLFLWTCDIMFACQRVVLLKWWKVAMVPPFNMVQYNISQQIQAQFNGCLSSAFCRNWNLDRCTRCTIDIWCKENKLPFTFQTHWGPRWGLVIDISKSLMHWWICTYSHDQQLKVKIDTTKVEKKEKFASQSWNKNRGVWYKTMKKM